MYTIISSHSSYTFSHTEIVIISLLLIWELAWKAVALWKAGHNNQPVWFVAMFLINSVGILEILYIFIFQRKRSKK